MIAGIGVDIVQVSRIEEVVKRWGDRFLKRVYSDRELEFLRKRKSPGPEMAARFAAKEAVFKALGTGWRKGVTWLDVETLPEPSGKPQLFIRGKALEYAQAAGIKGQHVSLSHDGGMAIAQVVLEA